METRLVILALLLIPLAMAVGPTMPMPFATQGTEVRFQVNGSLVHGGNLIQYMYAYDNCTNLLFSQAFPSSINNGSWNEMLQNVPVKFDKEYWMAYEINGELVTINGSNCTSWVSSLGSIDSDVFVDSINLSNATGYDYSNLAGIPSLSGIGDCPENYTVQNLTVGAPQCIPIGSGPQGPQGISGTNGTDGLNGTGITSVLDDGNGSITFFFSDGTNFTTINLTGATGPQGIPGIDGTNGTNGVDGINGTNGIDGVNGTNGIDGVNGTNGIDGINGSNANVTCGDNFLICDYSAPLIANITQNQTTLSSIYLNLSGTNADQNMNINSYNFTCQMLEAKSGQFNYTDYLEITQPATPPNNTLRLYAENIKGFSFYKFIDNTSMVRDLLRDSVFLVKNVRGTTIPAYRFVYATGSEDNIPTVDLAKADNILTMPAIGVTIEAITNGSYGRVMQVGLVENINSNTFNEGDVLYVSDTAAGTATATPPITPNLTQEMGTVLVKNATVGVVQVISRGLTGDEFGTINSFIVQGNLSALGSYHALSGNLSVADNISASNFLGNINSSYVQNVPDAWTTTFNSTYDAKVSDNTTWNETYANTLYAALGSGGNASWNETLANSLYYPIVSNPANYWNSTFAAFNKTYADTIYAPVSTVSDNASWNETRANSLYYLLTNPASYWNSSSALFNKTYADTLYSTIDEPRWAANFTAYNSSWSSTYNATYEAKAGAGACSAGQYETADVATAPTCKQINASEIANVSWALTGSCAAGQYVIQTNTGVVCKQINASEVQNTSWLTTTPYQSAAVGLVNITNWTSTVVNTGLLINTTVTYPACAAATRGGMWFVQGGVGVADLLYTCMKNSSNAYNWVQVAIG